MTIPPLSKLTLSKLIAWEKKTIALRRQLSNHYNIPAAIRSHKDNKAITKMYHRVFKATERFNVVKGLVSDYRLRLHNLGVGRTW